MPGKELTAIKLEQAKQSFEKQLEAVLCSYDKSVGNLQIDLNLEKDDRIQDRETDEDERALNRSIRELVDAFHKQEIVMQTGVRVYKVMAIDSNSDGIPAIDVKYEYAAGTGMGPDHIGAETSPYLPQSSAGEDTASTTDNT